MDWWVVVAELPYFGLAMREVEWFSRTLHRWFGTPLRGLKFYIATVGLSVAVTAVTSGTALDRYIRGQSSDEPFAVQVPRILGYWVHTFMGALRLRGVSPGIYAGNIVGDVFGMAVMLALLEKMTHAMQPRQLVRFLVLDVLVAMGFVMFTLGLTSGIVGLFNAEAPFIISVIDGLLSGPGVLAAAVAGNVFAISVTIPAVVAVVPSLFHIALIVAVLATKWATPILRPPILLVLERASEAERGVIYWPVELQLAR